MHYNHTRLGAFGLKNFEYSKNIDHNPVNIVIWIEMLVFLGVINI
jgi:hypothetical protein